MILTYKTQLTDIMQINAHSAQTMHALRIHKAIFGERIYFIIFQLVHISYTLGTGNRQVFAVRS